MKTNNLIYRALPGVTALLLLGSPALSSLNAQSNNSPKSDKSASRIRFLPKTEKSTSAPVRVTGGSRGTGDQHITLDVLTPDEVGLTTQEGPSLFWYQSKPADAQFELTLLQEDEIEPLVHVKVEKSSKAGIQRMRLTDHGVKLVPGVEYQWVVALITDPNNRSGDLVASGAIKRIPSSPELTARVSKADPAALAGIYAEAGIWYDALGALTDQIEAHPDNTDLVAARADLLSQVNLKVAATAQH